MILGVFSGWLLYYTQLYYIKIKYQNWSRIERAKIREESHNFQDKQLLFGTAYYSFSVRPELFILLVKAALNFHYSFVTS